MEKALLDRLYEIPERVVATTMSGDFKMFSEFCYEKVLGLLSKRMLGIESRKDISFGHPDLGLKLGNESVLDEDLIAFFNERYVIEQNNLYLQIADAFGSMGKAYWLNPNAMNNIPRDDKSAVEHLFLSNGISLKDEDVKAILSGYSDFESSIDDIYYNLQDALETEDYSEVPDIGIFFIISDKIGAISKTKNKRLRRAVDTVKLEFGTLVVDGVYYGYESFGMFEDSSYNDENPLIFQPKMVAAIKELKLALN